MGASLKNVEKAYNILKNYSGDNNYIITIKNGVYAYKTLTLNDFHIEFILNNYNKSPKYINKIVKIADWYGEKLQNENEIEFLPKVLAIGWYMGDTSNHYVFYGKWRKSQEKAILLFAPKNAILTDFLMEDFNSLDIDFSKYEKITGRTIKEQQKEGTKFLLSRKKAILSLSMGLGKTFTAILAALEGNYEHILVISPSSVKKTWENELKLLVDESDITIVQGAKWDDAKFTIINYDILDNFYTIPLQKVKQREKNVDENGNLIVEYKEKEIVSKNKAIIDKAMSNSQLFQANYDLIIIDEAHRLSNNTSGRFKIIQDLIKRSKPKGIFQLTGTMITNSTKNLYNLLKLIDVPITKDWKQFMIRYCGAKFFYKKNERNYYTAKFCKEHDKKEWDELTYEEKRLLDEVLEKNCKQMCIPGEDTNMEELQEIIKPYYLKRDKDEIPNMVKKTVKYLHYEMTAEEKVSYEKLWDKYVELMEDKEKTEKNKKLIETSLMRQWLADKMIPKTTYLVRKCVENNHKVIIFCAYDNEINKFIEEFKGICVYHNGKLNEKKKAKAVDDFQNNENIKVFIGNIFSAGVGITLTEADVVVFNNFSFVPADNLQAEDRIHRLNQTKPCTVYYQSFNDTYFDKMLEIVHGKEEVINKIIVTESRK